MLMYIVYLGAEFLATVFPLGTLYWIALRIADIQHFFARKGRAAVRSNLQVISEGRLTGKELDKAVKRTYYHFSLYLAEFFRMKRIDREYFDSNVTIVGLENIDAALKRGRGVVVVSAHYSNWELGLAYFAMRGYPAYGVVAPHRNKRVNSLFLKPRLSKGVRVIFTHNAIEEGYEALRNNGILCLLGDRVTTKGGVETTFFGHTTTFPKGPAKFAIGAHAPVVTGYIKRQPDTRSFVLTFDEPIYTDDLPDTEESVRRLIDMYSRKLESYMRQDPAQYGVFFNIWDHANSSVRGIQNQDTL